MDLIIAPFEVSFFQRALLAGALAAILCGGIGTWVVIRGMAFFGEAMSHGMLPGVALASLLGGHLLLGAGTAALTMAAGVSWVTRRTRLSQDVAIGLLFVGMLSAGVMIVSQSRSFAVDLTAFLFGDVLAVRSQDLLTLAIATALGTLGCLALHRPLLALTFDERIASTLGLHPRLAHAGLLGLTALATVAGFQVVGSLLVFGLLIGPPATACLLSSRIPVIMVLAAAIGTAATTTGLLLSWHLGTAAGATIAAVTVAGFFLTASIRAARD